MIALIAAVNKNNGIGYKNELLYDIPEDKKLFRELTLGKVVIMGRKTWLSLPHKPLPGRTNVVVSRHTISLRKALELYKDKDICIIGGGKVYKQAMRYADIIHLTLVLDDKKEADTFFPEIPKDFYKAEETFPVSNQCAEIPIIYQIWKRRYKK